jgi:hypothetical protein
MLGMVGQSKCLDKTGQGKAPRQGRARRQFKAGQGRSSSLGKAGLVRVDQGA